MFINGKYRVFEVTLSDDRPVFNAKAFGVGTFVPVEILLASSRQDLQAFLGQHHAARIEEVCSLESRGSIDCPVTLGWVVVPCPIELSSESTAPAEASDREKDAKEGGAAGRVEKPRPANMVRRKLGDGILALLAAGLAGLLTLAAYYFWVHFTEMNVPRAPAPAAPASDHRVEETSVPTPSVLPAIETTPEPLTSTFSVELMPGDVDLSIASGGKVILATNLADGHLVLSLPRGRYELQADKQGYSSVLESVELEGNEMVWAHTLYALTGMVRVISQTGVTVTAINDAGAGFDLGQIGDGGRGEVHWLREGNYRVVLSLQGHASATQEIVVKHGVPVGIQTTLATLPGRMEVVCSPKVEVWLAGRKIGMSGEAIDGIPAGQHRVQLRRSGYEMAELAVRIAPGEAVVVQAPPLVRESGFLRIELSVDNPKAREYCNQIESRLRIITNGTDEDQATRELIVDGFPPIVSNLACGLYRVELTVPGFVVQPSVPALPLVLKDRTTVVSFDVSPGQSWVMLTANVADAEIFTASGTRLGPSGYVMALPSFESTRLLVRAPGHVSSNIVVYPEWPGQGAKALHVNLEGLRNTPEGNLLQMKFVKIPSGRFFMGSASGDRNQKPVRAVRVNHEFWMSAYEVTQRDYALLMGENPSYFKGDQLPVESVAWGGAMEFCRRMTEKERAAGRIPAGMVYRLPTEAEWEYCASMERDVSPSRDLAQEAWFAENSKRRTLPVGLLSDAPPGIYDMLGNVWEWCLDEYRKNYEGMGVEDPVWRGGGEAKVIRGGAWDSVRSSCSPTVRSYSRPNRARYNLGFRVVLGKER